MQEKRPKFAFDMGKGFIHREIQKSFLRKPYIIKGVYWKVSGFLFQTCGLLGILFSDKDLVSFMSVFAAQSGTETSALELLDSMVSKEIFPFLDDSSSINELVNLRERARINSSEELSTFFVKHAQEKLTPSEAAMHATEWAVYGGILGLLNPEIMLNLFEISHKPEPMWEEAYKAGVVSTPTQVVLSVEDAESESLAIFRQYCEDFYPDLMPMMF